MSPFGKGRPKQIQANPSMSHIPLPATHPAVVAASKDGGLRGLTAALNDLLEQHEHATEFRDEHISLGRRMFVNEDAERHSRGLCYDIVEQTNQELKDLESLIEDARERIDAWKRTYAMAFRTWREAMEHEGHFIHTVKFREGPRTPPSLLMYVDTNDDDEGKPYLVFPRDHKDLYSSASFWNQYMDYDDPVVMLGNSHCGWVSSEQLGTTPEVLEDLFRIETEYLKTFDAALEEPIKALLKKLTYKRLA